MMGDEGGEGSGGWKVRAPPSSPIIPIDKAKSDLRPVLNENVIRNEDGEGERPRVKINSS